ncbi:MIP/aquaporin family protein [Candidatus Viridilinea mediisalina]|uniref:Aquaporin n=1 Tax=Candidatus Viridilinea mediisalina TaxID=2024553 RepID=A0A2A6RN76_9CHLR|nr:MIP/aquaporin family protein [Candidatus Viridilinea mediisalina]PDW04338.1 aquaporin [Candidatus Viridilinea mediisalina]
MPSSFLGELLGTMILVLLGNGALASALLNQTRARALGTSWLGVTGGWALGITTGMLVAQAAGSPTPELNPALTLAFWLRGELALVDALLHMLAQLSGAFLGALLVWLAYLPYWAVTNDAQRSLACFSTSPSVGPPSAHMISEIIATFVLVYVLLSLYSPSSPFGGNLELGIAPLLVGAVLWGLGLALGGSSHYAINPARDLGPRLAYTLLPISAKVAGHWRYAWVPVLGPLVGGLLATLVAWAVGL